jgi:hypothetical protein
MTGWYYDKAKKHLVSPDKKYTADSILEDSNWDDDSIEEKDEEAPQQHFSFDS